MNTQQTYEKVTYVKIDLFDKILTFSIKNWPGACPSHNQNSDLFCYMMGMSQAL